MAVLSLTLFACASATTQGQLQNILNDHSYEKFVYDVYLADNNDGTYDKTTQYNGTYTVTLTAMDEGASLDWAEVGLQATVSKGILVESKLEVGNTSYVTGCYFNLIGGSSYMVPVYSFRVQKDGDTETFKLVGSYEDASYKYTRFVNGTKSEGSLETGKSLYYDNNEFHQALRTITTFSNSLSYSFAVPLVSANEVSTVTLSAVVSGTKTIKTPYESENGIECYKTTISRSTQVAGVAQTLYYAVNDIKINGWGMKHVLVKIVEPTTQNDKSCAMIYELKEVELR